MAAKFKVTKSYLKNVGKSFGYTVSDVMAEYNPVFASAIKSSKNTISEVKDSIKEMKQNALASAKETASNQNAFTNIIDDLKSGNWYNKEREENGLMESLGLDFNFDDDFDNWGDDEDWGDDDESSSSGSVSREIIANNDNNSREVIKSVGVATTSLSKSMGKISARSAEYIVSNNNAAMSMLNSTTSAGFNQVSNILLSMNTNMSALVALGEPLANHMQNSQNFYIQTSESLNKITTSLEKIVERTKFLDYKPGKSRKKTIGDLVNGDYFDFGEYFDMVKENYKEQKEMITSMIGMGEMFAGKGGKNLSPLAMAMKFGFGKLIPEFTKEAMQELNKSLTNTIITGLAKGKKRSANSFLGSILGDIFFPDDKINKFDPSKYEKGAMSWNGVAHKALTEVIPTYLAKMVALLGGDEKYYDYDRGRFSSIKQIRKERNEKELDYARRAGGDFRKNIITNIRNSDLSDEKAYKIEQEVDRFFLNAMRNGDDFTELERKVKDSRYLGRYGISREAAKIIIAEIRASRGRSAGKKRNQYSSFGANIYKSRSDLSDYNTRESSKSNSNLNYINNNFSDNIRQAQMSQLDYIAGIYHIIGNMYSLNIATGYGTGVSARNIARGNWYDSRNSSIANYARLDRLRQRAESDRKEKDKDLNNYKRDRHDLKTINTGRYAGLSDEERKEKEKADRLMQSRKEEGKKLKDRSKELAGKFGELFAERDRSGEIVARNAYEAPFVEFSNMIGSMSDALNTLFYGDGSVPGIFDKVKDENGKEIGLKDKIKAYIKNSEFVEDMKDELVNMKNGIVNKVVPKNILTNIKAKRAAKKLSREAEYNNDLDDDSAEGSRIRGYARGGLVTKTGIAALSKGEFVIPANLNPFYQGYSDTRTQESIERDVIRRYISGGASKAGRNKRMKRHIAKHIKKTGASDDDAAAAWESNIVDSIMDSDLDIHDKINLINDLSYMFDRCNPKNIGTLRVPIQGLYKDVNKKVWYFDINFKETSKQIDEFIYN